jgi:hypothetical protein
MKFRQILTASAAVMLVAGCASYGMGGGYGYGYGPTADVEYDGYYDGAYGPIYDGYWGDNGVFFYRNSANGRYRQAAPAHVRRDAAPGFNHVHGTARAAPARNQDHPH